MPERVGPYGGLSGLLDQVRTHLDEQRLRQRVHLANVANADTPGYRAREVVTDTLGVSSPVAQTRVGHLGGDSVQSVRVVERSDLEVDPGGNNVELDEELAGLAEAALDIRVTSRSLSNVLAIYRSAATEVR